MRHAARLVFRMCLTEISQSAISTRVIYEIGRSIRRLVAIIG